MHACRSTLEDPTFYRLAGRATAAAEKRGRKLMPPDGEEFYNALVIGVLDALESAGTPAAEFAEELRQFWPGRSSDLDD